MWWGPVYTSYQISSNWYHLPKFSKKNCGCYRIRYEQKGTLLFPRSVIVIYIAQYVPPVKNICLHQTPEYGEMHGFRNRTLISNFFRTYSVPVLAFENHYVPVPFTHQYFIFNPYPSRSRTSFSKPTRTRTKVGWFYYVSVYPYPYPY